MGGTRWKDYLLKSGIPLEYEVAALLEKRNCQTHFEQSYLRPDENNIVNAFSYDLKAAYIPELHFFDLLIECKYRDPSTNWVFLPDYTTSYGELSTTSFVHVNDHFTQDYKHPFDLNQIPSIAPVCTKGIELTTDGQNPKTISQAVAQLSYALAEAIVEGMSSQISGEAGSTEQIFYHVPIVVTTANLYRLKEGTDIGTIRQANNIEDVSTKEDCVVLKTHNSKDLQQHSMNVFNEFIERYPEAPLNRRLKSFNQDIRHVCTVIAKHFCPEALFIINHTPESKGFEKLFGLLDELAVPTEKTIALIEDKKKKWKQIKRLKEWRQTLKNWNEKRAPWT